MRHGHWYKPLTEALRNAGCELVGQNSNHTKWRGKKLDAPLIVVSLKLNDGKFAHRLAKQAGVDLR
jgi:hypothetical protein